MKETYKKYLSVLRAFVQGSAPDHLDGAQVNEIMNLANINSTGGIVCYEYMTHPELVGSDILPLMRKQCLHETAYYARRAEQVKNLLHELDGNGIDCIVFKGFVVREYYPVPELRSFGDIDLVIRKEDRQRCHELMQKLGYEPKDDWEPAYSYLKGTEYYEFHTDVMEIDVSDQADYMSYYSHIWGHVQPCTLVAKPHVLEFSPEFHFLYLLTHIAKHISGSGAGIRMYLDIACFLKHFGGSLDWQWIQGELKKLHFESFANMVLTAAERWFKVESPLPLRPVSEEVLEDFLEFTLEGGIYGTVGRDKGTVFLKQQGRNDQDVSRWRTLLFHAFPPAKNLENRYTYLQKHRWLLPAAWVHRLVASRKEWGRFAGHTKDILTADSEDVRKLKRIYQEIGL